MFGVFKAWAASIARNSSQKKKNRDYKFAKTYSAVFRPEVFSVQIKKKRNGEFTVSDAGLHGGRSGRRARYKNASQKANEGIATHLEHGVAEVEQIRPTRHQRELLRVRIRVRVGNHLIVGARPGQRKLDCELLNKMAALSRRPLVKLINSAISFSLDSLLGFASYSSPIIIEK